MKQMFKDYQLIMIQYGVPMLRDRYKDMVVIRKVPDRV